MWPEIEGVITKFLEALFEEVDFEQQKGEYLEHDQEKGEENRFPISRKRMDSRNL